MGILSRHAAFRGIDDIEKTPVLVKNNTSHRSIGYKNDFYDIGIVVLDNMVKSIRDMIMLTVFLYHTAVHIGCLQPFTC